jgi:hypothetical protein
VSCFESVHRLPLGVESTDELPELNVLTFVLVKSLLVRPKQVFVELGEAELRHDMIRVVSCLVFHNLAFQEGENVAEMIRSSRCCPETLTHRCKFSFERQGPAVIVVEWLEN